MGQVPLSLLITISNEFRPNGAQQIRKKNIIEKAAQKGEKMINIVVVGIDELNLKHLAFLAYIDDTGIADHLLNPLCLMDMAANEDVWLEGLNRLGPARRAWKEVGEFLNL